MTGAADNAATERPVPLRRRDDLLLRSRTTAHGRQWLVKDPVRRRYYSLSEAEHALWQMLDGRTSLSQMQERFQQQFAPQRIAVGQLQEFLARLHRQGLVVSLRPGQGDALLERARTQRWLEAATLLPRLLAWRLPGIDPERYLAAIYPWLRWCFDPRMLLLAVVMAVIALGTVLAQAESLAERLPQLGDFFRAENVLLLLLALSVVKILHELGHGLVCKHFGGEVREIGVMFLFFAPCLYCDVSDAWLFPRRRDRMAISAAGMYVELWLASLAAIGWALSQPGLLNTFLLNIMLVCGAGTLLVNGNPLMRYDGYYLLADFLELPNLDQRAQSRVRRMLGWLLTGMQLPADSVGRERESALLLSYGIASTVYRVLVLVGMLWMLHATLAPLRLEVLTQLATAIAMGGLVAMPLIQATEAWRNPLMRRRLQAGPLLTRLGIAVGLIVLIVAVPFPCRVHSPAVLESQQAQHAYATVAGRLTRALPPGSQVAPNDVVAELDNPEIDLELAELATEEQRLKVRLRNLEAMRSDNPQAASEIPTTQQLLDDVRQRREQRLADRARLRLVASHAGTVVSPPWRSEGLPDDRLAKWQGSLLDARNRGAFVDQGTLVALVVDPARMEVVAIVDQVDIGLVAPGQTARVFVRSLPGKVYTGVVREVAPSPLTAVPEQLAAAGDVLIERTGSEARPLTPQYQVRIALTEAPAATLVGGRASVRIAVAPQSLASRLYRYLRQNFSRS